MLPCGVIDQRLHILSSSTKNVSIPSRAERVQNSVHENKVTHLN
jgi:hypothetical protein